MDSLTVSILNFNGKEVLPRCIESILSQGKPEHFELQLVDNSSTDNSEKEAFKNYPIEALIRKDNEHQFITGLNASFQHAKYENVLFVTNDVEMQPGSIMKLLELHNKFPKSIIQPVFYWPDGKVQNAGMNWVYPAYGLAKKSILDDYCFYKSPIVTTTAFIMSRSAWKEIGSFDEGLAPGHYEDVDYSLRAKKLRYRLLVDPQAKAVHIGAHSFNKVYGKKGISKVGHRNRLYIVNKHYVGLDKLLRTVLVYLLDTINRVIPLSGIGRIF